MRRNVDQTLKFPFFNYFSVKDENVKSTYATHSYWKLLTKLSSFAVRTKYMLWTWYASLKFPKGIDSSMPAFLKFFKV